MRNRQLSLLLLVFAGAAFAPGSVSAADKTAGLHNLKQINERLYRGGQPSAQGIRSLARMGIRTVLDLRSGEGHSVHEKKAVEAAGMRYMNLPLNALAAPTNEQMLKALSILGDDSAAPVFVHCNRGKDRTGTVIACYRIAHDGWPNKVALSEAKSLGMSPLERGMLRYILRFDSAGSAAPSALNRQVTPSANSAGVIQ